MLKLADMNARLHNVLYLTLSTPIREKRIAGFPTSQGKCPTDKVRQFPNFRTIIPIFSVLWSQFSTNLVIIALSCTLQAPGVLSFNRHINVDDDVNSAHGLYSQIFSH